MVLVVLILVFTSLGSLHSWDETEFNQFALLESWGISRVKRAGPADKVKEKFPDDEVKFCDTFHETREAPFTAVILFRTSGRLMCMGSIIDSSHILSAKRCYERIETNDVRVLVGYYKAYWGRHAQVRKIKKILRHEYALAILRMAKPLKFTNYIQAVRLPPSLTKTEKEFKKVFPPPYKVIGFEVDRYDVPGDFIDKDLTYTLKEDQLTEFDECKLNYTKMILEPAKLFCTMGNATYCWGGWGGPVLKYVMESYYLQVGVVIADNCTADTTGPFLVARTDVYGDWIHGNSYRGHHPS